MNFDFENFGDSNEKISSILDYLNEIEQPAKIVNDAKAQSDIRFLYEVTQIRKYFDLIDWHVFVDKQFYEVISEIVFHLFEVNNKPDTSTNDLLLLLFYSVKM